jgi:hypothetical protein
VTPIGDSKRRPGNPAWYRGMPPANPAGRPRGQNSIDTYCQDPHSFVREHPRWYCFCISLEWTKNHALAARRSGYSHKSARFIACRLLKKSVIKMMIKYDPITLDFLRRQGKINNSTSTRLGHSLRKSYHRNIS